MRLEYPKHLTGSCVDHLSTKRRQVMVKTFFVGALAVLFVGAASPAHADTNQSAYVHQLQAFGIPGSSDMMVSNGNVLCGDLNDGHDTVETANHAAPLVGLSVAETGYEIGAAIHWLCPQQSWQVKELIN